MNLELLLLMGNLLYKYGPTVAKEFQILFTKANPTQDDWDKIWKLAEEEWKDFE